METTTETPEATTTTEAGLTVGPDGFQLAIHDGVITLHNLERGTHRTVRIRTVRDNRGPVDSRRKPDSMVGRRLVELLVGPDNGSDYQAFGEVIPTSTGTAYVKVWYRFKNRPEESGQDGPSFHEKLAAMLMFPERWAGRVDFLASLQCRRCGHPLTHPASIADGLGPVCRTKM